MINLVLYGSLVIVGAAMPQDVPRDHDDAVEPYYEAMMSSYVTQKYVNREDSAVAWSKFSETSQFDEEDRIAEMVRKQSIKEQVKHIDIVEYET